MDGPLPKTEAGAFPRGGWGLFVAVLALLGVLFIRVHGVAQVRAEGLPLVVTDPAKLDFGERWEGETFDWMVPLANMSGRTVYVDEFYTSCGCVVVEPQRLEMRPGEHAALRCSIDSRASTDSPTVLNQVVELKGFVKNRSELVFSTKLYGRCRRLFDCNPPGPQLKRALVRDEVTEFRDFHVRPRVSISALSIAPSTEIQGTASKDGQDFSVRLRCTPRRSGTWTTIARFEGLDRDGRIVGRQGLRLSANVAEPVVALPSYQHFGLVPVGDEVEMRVLIGSPIPARHGKWSVQDWNCDRSRVVVSKDREDAVSIKMRVAEGPTSAIVRLQVLGPDGKMSVPLDVAIAAIGGR